VPLVDAATFRAVLGQWPTGVTLVTTLVDGQRYGVTASSFSSVSLDPPLVSVCLARTAFAHDLVVKAGSFGVTILAKDHAVLGQRFARYDPSVDRFDGLEWETAVTGSPLLASALGWLDCKVQHAYEGGDHTIFVGEVLAAATPRTTSPLLYHSRTWGQFADQLPEDVALAEGDPTDLVCDVAQIEDAVTALLARSDLHDRPRVVLRDAFATSPEALGAAVTTVVRHAPSAVVLVDDGKATPVAVREGCREAALAARPVPVTVRLSDDGGLGQANLLTALKSGIASIDLTDGLAVDEVQKLVTSLGLRLQGATA
jgi:flavin reductase (DIM6/NTAB) family NADH-FMN oxidoreductase RutF